MKTLQVTSPMMQGPDVKRAQTRLHSNKLGQDYMQGGQIDGVYGPETGRACIRAKFWCGYLTKDQTPTYGDFLDNFLTGKTPLPKNQSALRAKRLKAKTQKPLREKALERAAQDIGMKEKPANSNRCPISDRWGVVGPWCAMAVSTWYIDAGSKAFTLHKDWAYVPYMLASAVNGQSGLSLVDADHLQPGMVICYDWEQDGVTDHTGLFDHWIQAGRTMATIEGNTGSGNWSNGGAVERCTRDVSLVARTKGHLGFINVGR